MTEAVSSTEIPSLNDRALLISVGFKNSTGLDVALMREHHFAVVDGPGMGDDPGRRQEAFAVAGVLVERKLDTYFDKRLDPIFIEKPTLRDKVFLAGDTDVGFLYGYARGGGYIVIWNEKNRIMTPDVIYNGKDDADAPLHQFSVSRYTPIMYGLVMTDGGPMLFDPKGIDMEFYHDPTLIKVLSPITGALNDLRTHNLSIESRASDLRKLFVPPHPVEDDATALLFEIWNPFHPDFQRPL